MVIIGIDAAQALPHGRDRRPAGQADGGQDDRHDWQRLSRPTGLGERARRSGTALGYRGLWPSEQAIGTGPPRRGRTGCARSPEADGPARDSARTFGKSDPIDALSIARAALRETDLLIARLEGIEREIRLLVDHREDLVAEGTRVISRLLRHLHELDPAWAAPGFSGIVADLAQRLLVHLRRLTQEIDDLAAELTRRITAVAPTLLGIVGCGPLTETAGVARFRSKDRQSQLCR